MDTLSRNINSLENSVAKYIYIKYIQEQAQIPNDIVNQENPEESVVDNSSSSDSGDELKVITKTKVIRPKVFDKSAYNIYLKNIFHQSRSCFTLNQDDLIREDVRIMTLADKAYEEHPVEFKVGNLDLPPDVLRCSFIRKHHHRYYRCRNVIMNKDSDICKKHENQENIYYDNYNELLDKIFT